MNNCLSYAVRMWLMEGGRILVRRSLAGRKFGITSPWHPVSWVPHFLHLSRDGVITHYAPTERQVAEHRANIWKFWRDLWSFEGQVMMEDADGNPPGTARSTNAVPVGLTLNGGSLARTSNGSGVADRARLA